jgi:hypothetical protein
MPYIKMAEQEGLEPPTLSGSRFQGGVFIQPGLLHNWVFHFTTSTSPDVIYIH